MDLLQGCDADPNAQPFALDRAPDRRLPPKERVVLIRSARAATVIPFSRLQRHRVAAGRVGSQPYVVLFKRGVLSALDAGVITDSRDVGTVAAFDPHAGTRPLTFAPAAAGVFADQQTGSTWDITGRAIRGPLTGERLRPSSTTSSSRLRSPRSCPPGRSRDRERAASTQTCVGANRLPRTNWYAPPATLSTPTTPSAIA